jgi:ribosomal protein S12 methylthiotransferase accessory factor
MSKVVLVIGEGVLADLVSTELTAFYQVVRKKEESLSADDGVMAELALVLHDGWHPNLYTRAEKVFRKKGIPWLRGSVLFGEGIIGPLVRQGSQGCSHCADVRFLMAGRDRQNSRFQELFQQQLGQQRDVWSSNTGLMQMAVLIAAEAKRVLQGDQPHTEEHLLLVHLKTLTISRHFFLANPLCPICSELPDDSPEAARISLGSSPKVGDGYRVRSMDEWRAVLVQDYLDVRTGFFNEKMTDLVSPFAAIGVNLPLFGDDEKTGGRSHSYAESQLTAMLEGIERYGGLMPRGKRTAVHDSYRRLADVALHPVTVGVHAKEQYAETDFPFQEFDPDRPMNWVWGYSFLQERPLLVPEHFAYYNLGGRERIVYDTSNGCALGGSLEEAILYGILEVVERDSFLMTWYAGLPVPRLDLGSFEDKELRLMIDRFQAVTEYELYVFNTTMENGIPSVWALAKNKGNKGLNLLCAAGAHLDPLRAVKGAIHELSGLLLSYSDQFEADRTRYEEFFDNPNRVQHMEDHSMLYGVPKAEERLRFLLDDSRPMQSCAEAFTWKKSPHLDLTEDLKDVLRVFHRLHLDVVVVDQTTQEMKRNGLHCVKVLIPGMLPMTFGHRFIRLDGLERVSRVPAELGYVAAPLTREQLNLHPHPFP